MSDFTRHDGKLPGDFYVEGKFLIVVPPQSIKSGDYVRVEWRGGVPSATVNGEPFLGDEAGLADLMEFMKRIVMPGPFTGSITMDEFRCGEI